MLPDLNKIMTTRRVAVLTCVVCGYFY